MVFVDIMILKHDTRIGPDFDDVIFIKNEVGYLRNITPWSMVPGGPLEWQEPGGGTPYLKWQVCAYSKSKVGAYQVKCVLSKIWGHSVNNPSKNQAIPYQVQ